ncbi:kinase-like domain-containing protein [Rhizophagus diaphanus]|nr:kinase-like domain-containing protein [Rhizophagus diaphanus] [Rhizophagus sp. MUCL 43196]
MPADHYSKKLSFFLHTTVYGVIPYVAPEMFQGGVFSKESDIYSLGMIMWELTTGCKPFYNIVNTVSDIKLIYKVIDGKRPVITNDTPECYSNLMKRCWDSDPSNRPSITEIKEAADDWYKKCKKGDIIFSKAEKNRLELIQLKQIGPDLHQPSDIYSSRPLKSLISQVSSVSSSSATSKQVYDSEECKFDINNTRSKLVPAISKSLKSSFTNSSSISTLNTDHGYISTDLDFDIEMNSQKSMLSISSTTRNNLNTQHPDEIYSSRPLSTLISNIKNNSELNNKN